MADNNEAPVELVISPEKIGFIIVKAREYDAKVGPNDEEFGLRSRGVGIQSIGRP